MSVEATFGRDAGVIEPRRRRVARLVQPDRLQPELAPLAMHALLECSPSDSSPDGLYCRGGQTLPSAGRPCAIHAFRSIALQRLDERHDPPRAARLAAFLVGCQLDGAELQVDVAASPACGSPACAPCRSRPARTAARPRAPATSSSCRELRGRRDAIARRRIHRRQSHVRRRVVADELAILRPAVQRAQRVDDAPHARARRARARQVVDQRCTSPRADVAEPTSCQAIGHLRSADSKSCHARRR